MKTPAFQFQKVLLKLEHEINSLLHVARYVLGGYMKRGKFITKCLLLYTMVPGVYKIAMYLFQLDLYIICILCILLCILYVFYEYYYVYYIILCNVYYAIICILCNLII